MSNKIIGTAIFTSLANAVGTARVAYSSGLVVNLALEGRPGLEVLVLCTPDDVRSLVAAAKVEQPAEAKATKKPARRARKDKATVQAAVAAPAAPKTETRMQAQAAVHADAVKAREAARGKARRMAKKGESYAEVVQVLSAGGFDAEDAQRVAQSLLQQAGRPVGAAPQQTTIPAAAHVQVAAKVAPAPAPAEAPPPKPDPVVVLDEAEAAAANLAAALKPAAPAATADERKAKAAAAKEKLAALAGATPKAPAKK